MAGTSFVSLMKTTFQTIPPAIFLCETSLPWTFRREYHGIELAPINTFAPANQSLLCKLVISLLLSIHLKCHEDLFICVLIPIIVPQNQHKSSSLFAKEDILASIFDCLLTWLRWLVRNSCRASRRRVIPTYWRQSLGVRAPHGSSRSIFAAEYAPTES